MSEVALGLGTLLMLLAGLGAVKLPDLFTRIAAISKASTLGILLWGAVALAANADWLVQIKLGLGILIFFLGAPTASHLIARAGYRSGSKLFKGTVVDEWKDKT